MDKLRVEDKAKDREEILMRAITMMKRNTNEDEELKSYTDDEEERNRGRLSEMTGRGGR